MIKIVHNWNCAYTARASAGILVSLKSGSNIRVMVINYSAIVHLFISNSELSSIEKSYSELTLLFHIEHLQVMTCKILKVSIERVGLLISCLSVEFSNLPLKFYTLVNYKY